MTKQKKNRVVPTGFLFIVLFSFSMQAYIVAVGTLTLKDTHSGTRQFRSSCGSAETQTGACAHTHTHRGAFQGGSDAVALTCLSGLCLCGSGSRGE